MNTAKIKWVKPCAETSVHYGYVEGDKRFYIFHDKDRPALFGRWVLKQADNNRESMHVTLEHAQGAAAYITENDK